MARYRPRYTLRLNPWRIRLWLVTIIGLTLVGAPMAFSSPSGATVPGCHQKVCIGQISGVMKPRRAALATSSAARTTLAPQHLGGGPVDASPLVYQGGPVLHNPKMYNIYWTPTGFDMPSGFQTALTQMQQDLAAASGATDNTYSVTKEYFDNSAPISNSIQWGGASVDTATFPAGGCSQNGFAACLSSDQIQTEVQNQIVANGWPTATQDVSYNMFLPPNVSACDSSDLSVCAYTTFCAFHTAYELQGATNPIPWSLMMDATGNNCEIGNPGVSEPLNDILSVQGELAHEATETITDPLTAPGSFAWINKNSNEIADMCVGDYGNSLGNTAAGWAFNQLINGHPYILPTIWSNSASGCLQAAAGSGPPPTTTTVPSTSTTSLPTTTSSMPSTTVPGGTTTSIPGGSTTTIPITIPSTTSTSIPGGSTTTTVPGVTTIPITIPSTTTTSTPGGSTTSSVPGGSTTTTSTPGGSTTTTSTVPGSTTSTTTPTIVQVQVEVAPGILSPGDATMVSGDGFAPGDKLVITLHSTPVLLGSVIVDNNKHFQTSVVIPLDTTLGKHDIVITTGDGHAIPVTISVIPKSSVTTFTIITPTTVKHPTGIITDLGLPRPIRHNARAPWGYGLLTLAVILLIGGLATMRRSITS